MTIATLLSGAFILTKEPSAKPLSIALLGGLSISTIFTLVIVPTIYGAIRNKIPLKDYDKKDFESKKDFIK